MYSVSLREAAQILDVPMDEIRRKIKKGELRATQVVTPGGLGMGVALPGDPPEGVAQSTGNTSQNAPAVERTPGLSELFKDSPLMQPVQESQAQTQRQAAGPATNTSPAAQPAPSPNMTETNGPIIQASTQKEPLRGQAEGPAISTSPAAQPAPSPNMTETNGPIIQASTQKEPLRGQAEGPAGDMPPAVQPAPSSNMAETNGPIIQASTQKEPLRGQAEGPAGNTPPAVQPAPSPNSAETNGPTIQAAAQEQVTPQGLTEGNSGVSSFKVESVGNLMNSLRGQVEAQLAVRQREIQELRDLLQHLQTLTPTTEASSRQLPIESLRIETPVVPLANQAPVTQGVDIREAQQEKPRTPWWKFRLR